MNQVEKVFLLLGVLCFVYFFVLISYAGVRTSFVWFWLVAGAFFVGLKVGLFILRYKGIILPRTITVGAITCFVILGSVFLMVEGILVYYGGNKPKKEAEYVIVLGAQVKGRTISKALRYRLDVTVEYLKQYDNAKVIVSGGRGQGELISEAEAMSRYLLEHGIEKHRIIMEDNSVNTYENIEFSRRIIGDTKENTVIISNSFHIYRAVSIAKRLGFTQIEGLGGRTDRIMWLHYYVREFFAVIKYKIRGMI